MKVASEQTNVGVYSLNEEIPLFEDDSDWNFMDVLDTHEQNFEYFSDIHDKDFQKGRIVDKIHDISPLLSLVAVVVTCMVVGITSTGLFVKDKEYEAVKNAVSVEAGKRVTRVDGEECSAEDTTSVKGVLDCYFSVLHEGKGYDSLYTLMSATSTFSDTYTKFKDTMEHAYDINDSYARALSLFGVSCDVVKVKSVVYSDGIYYCYADLKLPTSFSVGEYIYKYQQNLTKWFKTNDVCEENMIRFLENTANIAPMPVVSNEYCIRFIKKDGAFFIQDDSVITSSCVDGYTVAISKMNGILSGSLTD